MQEELDACLDWIWDEVRDDFNLAVALPMHVKTLWRCVAVFKRGETSLVYCASEDRKSIRGAIICSDSFSGVRGEITDSELDFVRGLHPDLTINR